jgi:23S rRNA pseudouridine1911/1915/1917 synthase
MQRPGQPPPRDGRFTVPDGPQRPLDRVLRELLPGTSWNDARRLVTTGKVRIDGVVVRDPTQPALAGASLTLHMSAPRPREGVLQRDVIVFRDPSVVVVRKPAGIATVPFGDERDTLDRLVQALLRKVDRGVARAPLGVVQRLDKETSGLIVFARTTSAKRGLQDQFRKHSVHRRYVAVAHGDVSASTFRSRLVQDRGDGIRGSTDNPLLGREAVTRVRPIERLRGATLVECALETGRTHQIRIHLSEAGHPLVGERVYVRGHPGSLIPAPRLLLHAAELGFVHPKTGEQLRFEDPVPADMVTVIRDLGIG